MKNSEMGKGSVLKLVIVFSIPSVLSTIVNSLYNIADRYFIGKYAGEIPFAGLTMAFPLMMAVIAISAMLAIGGAAIIAIKMGEKNLTAANEAHGTLFTIALIIGVLTSIIVYFIADPLYSAMGGTPEVIKEANSYTAIIVWGITFQMYMFTLGGLMRVEGRPNLAMVSIIISGLINILLDYIFVAKLGTGVKGAAIATVISQIIGFIILAAYFFSGKSLLKIYVKNLIPRWNHTKIIFKVGSSSFFISIGTSFAMVLYNSSAISYGGINAVTALGAIGAIETIAFMPLVGMQQGVQPLIGYNFGAGKLMRTKNIVIYSILVGMAICSLGTAIILIFPEFFLRLFIETSSPTMAMAISGLKVYVLGLPFLPIAFIGTIYFQSTVQAGKAFILGIARHLLITAPLLIILPHVFGLYGVWLVMPSTDTLHSIVTLLLLIPALKRIKPVQFSALRNKKS